MAHYVSKRKRRQRNRRLALIGIPLVLVIAGGIWWQVRAGGNETTAPEVGPLEPTIDEELPVVILEEDTPVEPLPPPPDAALTADEEVLKPAVPVVQPIDPSEPDDDARVATPDDPGAARISNDTRTDNAAIQQARRLIDAGKPIQAREALSTLLARNLSTAEAQEVRSLLTRLADETIFSAREIDGDPLTDTYTVQPGDRLVHIAPQYNVPHDALMRINNIRDASRLRAGQRLKVVRGPFHAKIDKSEFRMDVYLGDLYVKSFRVGLGKNGTPEGVWKVTTRLRNPRYYPPASSPYKHEIAPDDPNNPLGERWIGLEGLEGDALNREGYGIHGTIEPESIGQAVSLGCIRMHNEDVEFLYDLLVPGQSRVTIVP